jgi:uncharacterized Zn-binding protein involved in type VI secretion
MTMPCARIGDRTRGHCHVHNRTYNGLIITGSPDVVINNRSAARVGDIVRSDCGHIGKIVTGASTVTDNNRLQARIGDKTIGDYEAVIITGSPDTLTGA